MCYIGMAPALCESACVGSCHIAEGMVVYNKGIGSIFLPIQDNKQNGRSQFFKTPIMVKLSLEWCFFLQIYFHF